MPDRYLAQLRTTLEGIRADGFHKGERVIRTPQSPAIELADGAEVLNFCANNYLGLADDPRLVAAARDGLARYGFGMASVRFICGTQSVHKELEAALAAFLETDDSILYSSCFDANGGLFETLLNEEDAVISDELNHASIVDGIRLCKAKRYRYRNNDMADLAAKLAGGRRGGGAVQADRNRRRVLDGRDHRRPGVDLRSGRAARRVDDGRRLARRRLRRRTRARHPRVLRRRRADRHPHRNAGQGAGWRIGWLYGRAQGNRRSAAPALAPVPVLQLARARHRGCVSRGAGVAARGRGNGAAPARAFERRSFPAGDNGPGF